MTDNNTYATQINALEYVYVFANSDKNLQCTTRLPSVDELKLAAYVITNADLS